MKRGRAGRIVAAALTVAGVAAPATAGWKRATTDHFVVYDDASEGRLRDYATELERFDALLRFYHRVPANPDERFNKVTIYVVSPELMRKLAGDRNIAGFYKPRVEGSVAFTPDDWGGSARNGDLTSRIVLFHEYAHHFLLGSRAAAYPRWFSEGYAEFASTARRDKDTYLIGAPALHRAYSLLSGPQINATTLFTPPTRLDPEQWSAFYGRGWLLTHYSMFKPERFKQLNAFLRAFNEGKPTLAAASDAYGELPALDRDLDRYVRQPKLPVLAIKTEALGNPVVDVATLSPGEDAMLPLRIRSTAGVDEKLGRELYAKAAPIAARFTQDAVVQGWFAEMAWDAKERGVAEKAADAAIAADPKSSQGLLYKARIRLFAAAAAGNASPATWKDARSYILRANQAENNDAAALRLFYDSYLMARAMPPAGAVLALDRAVELVPQDGETRFLAAQQAVLDGKDKKARALLQPLAADPHRSGETAAARILAALDAGKRGQAALEAAAAAAKAAEKAPPPGKAS